MVSGVRPLSSLSRKRMEPALGTRAPEMQLKAVVLPEPFRPMSPRISPSRTSNDTSLRAMNPPNCLISPDTVNIAFTRLLGLVRARASPAQSWVLGGGRSPSARKRAERPSEGGRSPPPRSEHQRAKYGEDAGSRTGGFAMLATTGG